MAGFDPITAGLNLGDTIIKGIFDKKEDQDKARAQLIEMTVNGQIQQVLGQITIDQTEAQSKSVWVAGWRPYVGWICGTGFGYVFVIQPFLTFLITIWKPNFHAPTLDVSTLSELLMALLGMGALRTVDKVKGVNSGT